MRNKYSLREKLYNKVGEGNFLNKEVTAKGLLKIIVVGAVTGIIAGCGAKNYGTANPSEDAANIVKNGNYKSCYVAGHDLEVPTNVIVVKDGYTLENKEGSFHKRNSLECKAATKKMDKKEFEDPASGRPMGYELEDNEENVVGWAYATGRPTVATPKEDKEKKLATREADGKKIIIIYPGSPEENLGGGGSGGGGAGGK